MKKSGTKVCIACGIRKKEARFRIKKNTLTRVRCAKCIKCQNQWIKTHKPGIFRIGECASCGGKFETTCKHQKFCSDRRCRTAPNRLPDSYVKIHIVSGDRGLLNLVTPEMIEQKKAQLKLRRIIYEKSRKINTP